MTATVLVLGGLGIAALWIGLYLADEDGLSRAQEREQLRRWTSHLEKPLNPR